LSSVAAPRPAEILFLWFQKKGIYTCVRQHGKKPQIGHTAELEAVKNFYADLYKKVISNTITEQETDWHVCLV